MKTYTLSLAMAISDKEAPSRQACMLDLELQGSQKVNNTYKRGTHAPAR